MLKKIICIIAICVFSFFLERQAFSVPVVSDANESAGVITITGTGFGNHDDESGASFPYLNAAWDNFETGTLNSSEANLQMDPDWPNACRISTSFLRNNSSYTMQKFYNTGQVYPRLGGYQHFPPNNTPKVFGSFWFYTEPGNQSGKFFRLRADEADQDPEGDSFISTGGGDFNIRGGCANMPNCATVWTSPYDIVPGTWHKIEFINETTSNATVYLDGRLDWSVGWWVNSGLDLGGGSARTIVGAMIDEGSGTYNYDDVYISYTEARVEICDVGGTFHDGTVRKCETQIPTSWTSTTIEVNANNGAFNENDTAYLYVIDSSGVASSAVEVTIGSGGSGPTYPTVSSATVDSTGLSVDIVFSETVVTTGYTSGDFNLDCTTAGSNISLTSPSGSGSSWSFTIGTTIYSGDSCNLDYNGASDGIEDGTGDDLQQIIDGSVTVNGANSNPTLSSATVDSTGDAVDLVFNETVVVTGYTSGDFDLDCTLAGSNIALSSPTGSGTSWSFSTASTIYSGDTCNIDFNGAANSIENGSGGDLQSITDGSVTVVGASSPYPVLSTATVQLGGTSVDLVFDQTVVTTGYTSGDFDIDCTTAGNDIALSSPTGSGVNWSFTIGTTVNSGDTCNIDFNGAANSIEDGTGDDLQAITNGSVTVIGATTIPSITGVTQDSGTITVTGANFGLHDDYSSTNASTIARAWRNFEDGSVLADDWYYAYSGAYSENWQAATGAVNRANSTYFAARNYVNSRYGEMQLTQAQHYNEWYGSFYIQISDTCPTSGLQGILARVWGDNGDTYWAAYGSTNLIQGVESTTSGTEDSTDSLGTNTWHRVETYMSQSPQKSSLYIDGKLQWTRTDWPASDFNGGSHSWGIGTQAGDVQNTCYHRYDDVYFDHTQARIEVCETGGAWSTAAAKHCEVQIPTSWTSTSIEVAANYGTFDALDSVYLYAIDSNGNASDPYNITLSDIGGGEAPKGQGIFSGGFGAIDTGGTGNFQ